MTVRLVIPSSSVPSVSPPIDPDAHLFQSILMENQSTTDAALIHSSTLGTTVETDPPAPVSPRASPWYGCSPHDEWTRSCRFSQVWPDADGLRPRCSVSVGAVCGVRSRGSQGRAKAEGCSPSVSHAHSKGAISQD